MTHSYCISGLRVASEFELPGAIALTPADEACDVTVQHAVVPDRLDGGAMLGPNWDMAGGEFLLTVPQLGRFLIRNGSEICVALNPGATEPDASAYVLGTAFGILLHQRGALVLHGSAVERNGETIAICGHSGAGKSTLAAALCRAGCTFVTDDICAGSVDAAGTPIVLPDGRQLKLWQEAIEKLELGKHRGDAVRRNFEKYFIAPQTVAPDATPLRAIYVLREARPPFADGIEELSLADAMHALDREAYRPGLRARMVERPQMLAQGATMLAHVKIFRLIRPRAFENMAETVSTVLSHWDGLAP